MLINAFLLSLLFSVCFAVSFRIDRPCDRRDYGCIGKNLAANSGCNKNVARRLASAYKIPHFEFHTPSVNASYVDLDLVIRNHDQCYVAEFFYTMDHKTLVLGIDCPNLDFESNRLLIQHFSLREDVTFSYKYRGFYPRVHLTVNLRVGNGMNLCKSLAIAETTGLPRYEINPNNKKTANSLSTDLSLLKIFEQESMWWRANSLVRIFVNSLLCDFGCNF